MAKVLKNNKNFRVIKLNSLDDIERCGFGFRNNKSNTIEVVCDNCNKLCNSNEELYYVAVLNRLFCKDCYFNWYSRAQRYAEDIPYEEKLFKVYAKALGIAD